MPSTISNEASVHIHKYYFTPTKLIPNSPRPLLHYKYVFSPRRGSSCDPVEAWKFLDSNGWKVSWIFRYGQTQASHYHSRAHECMAVLSGAARIRFGVADTSPDLDESTFGSSWEDGGIELDAEAGDVFVIPAGVAHKTYSAQPEATFKLLTPGKGHGIETDDIQGALECIKLDGFTMLGAYSGGTWDFIEAGGMFEQPWSVPKPRCDPVLGDSKYSLLRLWLGSNTEAQARLPRL